MIKKNVILLTILSIVITGCINIEKANINIQPEQTKSEQPEQIQKSPISTIPQMTEILPEQTKSEQIKTVDDSLILADQMVNEKWSKVENEYQRRADLIPNFVETVKGYVAHEKIVMEDMTKARSQWASANTIEEKINAAKGIDSALSRLMLVVENYPQLKASENFAALQAQLEGTENRITVTRADYNSAVRNYNQKINGIYGYEPKPLFDAEKGSEKAPKVIN